MNIVILLCWLLSLIFAALYTLAVASHPRFLWLGAGLFFFILAEFLAGLTGASLKFG